MRWTIGDILESDWIRIQGQVKMNKQESLAFTESLNINKLKNQKPLKKIEINRSDTQEIMSKQLPRFFSVSQQM